MHHGVWEMGEAQIPRTRQVLADLVLFYAELGFFHPY